MTSRICGIALGSAIALWSSASAATAAALPGSSAMLVPENMTLQEKPVISVRHGNCGRRCFSKRSFRRGPRSRGRVRGRHVSRTFHRRRGGRHAYRHSGPRKRSIRRAYRHPGRHHKRSYKSYGHYRKHCRRNCGRFRHRHRQYSHYRSGWWYAWPWWAFSVPVYAYTQDYYGDDDLHVAYCLRKYRSYDPRSDTYVAYSGRVRRCRSPYSG